MSPEFELSARDLHVWRIDINCGSACPETVLSMDETARAARFRFDADRTRYVISRSALRLLLGRYLAQDPGAVPIGYSPRGKPQLYPGLDLHFNVSHSGNVALIAFARNRVGIDVEQIRPVKSLLDIAQRYFTESEIISIANADQADQSRAFLSCWTRKEAYLKATGEGLAALNSPPTGQWTFFTPPTPENYIAAGVVEGVSGPIKVRIATPQLLALNGST